ncbi:hypothetical protein NUW54_g13907 [Trametes sanguinea]|uniref:Uncharacterized protein n=1 Tax=Trametes sanguinea TaxID=158606 RepID=A0ACC1MH26_9APHY|nr:hypothetical protein NUW54_g13907 [Trametes sanguinea]
MSARACLVDIRRRGKDLWLQGLVNRGTPASHLPKRPPPLTSPFQLKFASGSLAEYLNIKYSEKLPSSSTVDDIEGTLSKFIPPGYYTDEQKFLERVEEDAINFKPYGQKIYSYTRSATTLIKGKNVAIPQVLSPEDQETVDFEVYHVSAISPATAQCSVAALQETREATSRPVQPRAAAFSLHPSSFTKGVPSVRMPRPVRLALLCYFSDNLRAYDLADSAIRPSSYQSPDAT